MMFFTFGSGVRLPCTLCANTREVTLTITLPIDIVARERVADGIGEFVMPTRGRIGERDVDGDVFARHADTLDRAFVSERLRRVRIGDGGEQVADALLEGFGHGKSMNYGMRSHCISAPRLQRLYPKTALAQNNSDGRLSHSVRILSDCKPDVPANFAGRVPRQVRGN